MEQYNGFSIVWGKTDTPRVGLVRVLLPLNPGDPYGQGYELHQEQYHADNYNERDRAVGFAKTWINAHGKQAAEAIARKVPPRTISLTNLATAFGELLHQVDTMPEDLARNTEYTRLINELKRLVEVAETHRQEHTNSIYQANPAQ